MATHLNQLTQADKKWLKQLQTSKGRNQESLFIVEGPKLIDEMIRHFQCHTLIGTATSLHPYRSIETQIKRTITLADNYNFSAISHLKSPRPLIAVLHQPTEVIPDLTTNCIVVLDGVQDPGNVGAIIRSCDWFGIKQIWMSDQTADPYSPRVVQASMGALARVQIIRTNQLKPLIQQITHNTTIIGTYMNGLSLYEYSCNTPDRWALIMGNEGNGISDELSQLVTQRITIPAASAEHCESLNVSIATAITLSHLQ